MIRLWICDACGEPCVLVFWPNHMLRGSHCCLSTKVHTEKRDTPAVQVRL